jgi:hypothetical protein
MHARISRISLIVFTVLLVLSGFLLSVPGDYVVWYAIMVPFTIVPLALGPRWYRVGGACALALSAVLIGSDIKAGKAFRERMHRFSAEKSQTPPAEGQTNHPNELPPR